jgi:uncharacterized membrane protein
MMTKRNALGLILYAMIAVGGTAAAAAPQERGDLMTQHVREEVRNSRPVGSLPAERVLHFDMLLPVRAPEELEHFLADVYNPASAAYRRFVTPPQFTARFGPSQADWNELLEFARRNGFTITGGSRDEMDLRLAGSVRAVETAFHVKLRLFTHPTEARAFYGPDTEPTVDMQAAVWHISGLDNFSIPHARVHPRAGVSAQPLTASGACPGNSYCGSDMRAAYYGSGSLTGTGQSVGLVEFAGYDSADLEAYYANAGQSNRVPVNGVSADGTPVNCLYSKGCDDTEQTLDITQTLGMAPGLAQLNVYVGGSDTAVLSAMSVPPAGSATGKVDAQLSCSWGWAPADPATDDPLFKKFAAQGQSFFTAAGDSAAYTKNSQYVYPADDANVTVVGGTDLSTTGPGGAWSYESVWSDGGGGYFAADNIAIPAWQSAAIAAFNAQSGKPGSTTLRNSPDVSAEANFDFYVCANQQACSANEYGGTSFAAPMWAGFMALANQQAALNGRPPVGFLNAAIYGLGNTSGTAYTSAFHDVSVGSNGYPAVAGFDLATGWGSPNGAGLIAALAGSSTPGLSLSSTGTVAVAAGGAGTATLTSTATGGFNSAVALSASGQPNGVTVGFSPATITGTGTSTVTFQAAATVAAGTYAITLTGTSTGTPRTTAVTTVTLTVTAPNFSLTANGPVTVIAGNTAAVTVASTTTGGFKSAVTLSATGQPGGVSVQFSPSSISGSGTSTLSFQVAPTAAAGVYPITVTGAGGGLTHGTSVTVTVVVPGFSLAASAGSLSLPQGSSGSVTLTSTTTGGFSAPMALSAAGLPNGVTVGFAPASITGAGSSTVSVTAAANTAPGAYPLLLTATSGTIKQSTTVTLTVGSATLSITAAAPSLAAVQGAGASMTLATTVTGALTAPVALSISGQPTGVVASLGAASLVPPGGTTLTISVAPTAMPGSYPITLVGVSGVVTARVTVTLVVAAVSRPTFVFGVGTTALTLTHGTSSTFAVQTASTGTTMTAVALSASGLPSGVTATFSASTLNGAGTSMVTVTAAATAKAGATTSTISGTSGAATQSATVTVTVN